MFLPAGSSVVEWPSLAEGGVSSRLPGWKLNFLWCTSHYRVPAEPQPLSAHPLCPPKSSWQHLLFFQHCKTLRHKISIWSKIIWNQNIPQLLLIKVIIPHNIIGKYLLFIFTITHDILYEVKLQSQLIMLTVSEVKQTGSVMCSRTCCPSLQITNICRIFYRYCLL